MVILKNLVTPASVVMGAAPSEVVDLVASTSPGATVTVQGEPLIGEPSKVIESVYVPAKTGTY